MSYFLFITKANTVIVHKNGLFSLISSGHINKCDILSIGNISKSYVCAYFSLDLNKRGQSHKPHSADLYCLVSAAMFCIRVVLFLFSFLNFISIFKKQIPGCLTFPFRGQTV